MSTTTAKRQSSPRPNKQGLVITGIVIIVVAVVAITAILLSGNLGTAGEIDFASLPQSRAADGGFVIGNPNAPVTLIEFADFACSHCQEYHPTIVQFIKDYVATGKAKFEYRMIPTAGGQLSYYSGQLLECAENQKAGSFWKGYELMYGYVTSGRYTQDVGRVLANDLGLNYSELLSCSADAKQVQTDVSFGTQVGVQGTPATMVRYSDGTAQYISYNGVTYNQGAAPYAAIAALTEAAQ